MTIHDTARSLIAWFGTTAEWGEIASVGIHHSTPALAALAAALVELVPAAWDPYSHGLYADVPRGWVTIPDPNSLSLTAALVLHGVSQPLRWTEPDPAAADPDIVRQATIAALVGLAAVRTRDGDEEHDRSEAGDDRDSIGGE